MDQWRKLYILFLRRHGLTGILLIAAIAGFALYAAKPSVSPEPVPGFPLRTFEGSVLHMEELIGTPIILNFWAEWCTFCRDEMPIMDRIAADYRDRVLVLGVHRTSTEPKEVGERFAREIGVTYTLVEDVNDRLFNYFGSGAPTVPLTIFIDSRGFIHAKIVGPRTEEQFRSIVSSLLKN